MPDENTQDNREHMNAEDIFSTDYVLEHWITIKEAAEIMFMNDSSVSRLCTKGILRSRKIGGRWYVDPYAAHSHKKGQHRRSN